MPLISVETSVMRAVLRLRFGDRGTSEKYYIPNPGNDQIALNILNLLCQLRSSWMGSGVVIEYAALSDTDNSRDSIMADNLPYVNPWAGIFGPVVNGSYFAVDDPATSYQYRLQTPAITPPFTSTKSTGSHAYHRFGGGPGGDFNNFSLAGQPWPTPATPASYIKGMIYYAPVGTLTAPGSANAPSFGAAINALIQSMAGSWSPQARWIANGNSLIPFLLKATVPVRQQGVSGGSGYVAGGAWSQMLFRRVISKRWGRPFSKRKGRFTH